MKPCFSDVEGVCGTKDEVKAFYAANPSLQFMFRDHFYNFNDYEGMFDSYINTVNYVSVDPAYLSNVNFFVRKIFLDS